MSELIIEITDKTFDTEILQNDGPCLVDFTATFCPPCKIIEPFLDELAKEFEGKVKFGKYNIEDHQDIAIRYSITAAPTIMIFAGGELKERIIGAVPKKKFKEAIEKVI